MAPERPADYLRICASGSKGTERRLRAATAASARAAHRCDEGPALCREAPAWAAPHTGTPAGAWRRGCGKPWGAPTTYYTMPCHTLTERSQNMLTATHASIHPLPPLSPLSMNNTQLSCRLLPCPPVSYIPQPQKVPPHQIKQHMPCMPQVPPPAAWHTTKTHSRAHARSGAKAQAKHAMWAMRCWGSTVNSPARRCISSGRYTVLYNAAAVAASGSTLRAGGARGSQGWGPHSGLRAMCGS